MKSDKPAEIISRPSDNYRDRKWQGIPGIERAPNGRLFATWYTGGDDEGPGNYVVVVISEDEGMSWSEPILTVIPPEPGHRVFDPCLWLDPMGRLWVFWAQSQEGSGKYDGCAGVCSVRCDFPDDLELVWSKPRRLANGIMMNKPTVISNGDWLMPAAVWEYKKPFLQEMAGERFSNVYCSKDHGETWVLLGGADVKDRQYDEHMLVERKDGSLWMLVRTRYGIGTSVSKDSGKTWQNTPEQSFPGPGSRFFIRRLKSGALLLVNHYKFSGRSNLTAMISDDEGYSWKGHLLLDGRNNVSYPDGVQSGDGRIFIIYDRERKGKGEILMAIFREEDVRAGEKVSKDSRFKMLISNI